MMFCRAPQQQQPHHPAPPCSFSSPPTLFSEARADHADVVARVLAANPAAASVREAATGGTALHAACAAGALGAVRALLAAPVPARLDAIDDAGDTPLHRAARGGHADVVEELLSLSSHAGSSSLTRRKKGAGRCPLHEAAASCSHEACRALLSAGARRLALDAEGLRAADLVPRDANSTKAAVLYAMVLSSKSATAAEKASAVAAVPSAAAPSPAAAANLLPRRRDSRPWVATAAARIASARKASSSSSSRQQEQKNAPPSSSSAAFPLPAAPRQQLRVYASASTDYGGESPAAAAAANVAAAPTPAPAGAAAPSSSTSAAAAGLFAESCSNLIFVGARSVKGAGTAKPSSSSAAAAAAAGASSSSSSASSLRVAAAERRVEEVVDVLSRLAAAVEGTCASVEADREAARREVAALRDEARQRAAAADEALAAVNDRLQTSLEEMRSTMVMTRTRVEAAAAAEEEEGASYSSDDSATSYETAPGAETAAAAAAADFTTTSTSASPAPSPSGLPLSTELAHELLLKNAVPSFAHIPHDVDGVRGALASLERRVARGEEWDAAASGFARSVGLELEKLQLEVGACARARLTGEARLDATERGVEMIHGYLKTAAAALGPEAVEDARKRGAAVAAAAATLANEKRHRKAMETELRRVKEACRELQGRLDEVEAARLFVEEKEGRTKAAKAEATTTATEASAARPRNRRRSFFGGIFGPSTIVSKLGKGERRRLSSSSGPADNGLALATRGAIEEGDGETRVVVEEAES